MQILKCNCNKFGKYEHALSLIILLSGLATITTLYIPTQGIASSDSSDQEEDDGENPIPTGAPTEGHLAYIDSLGRFRIDYPADAIISPLKDLPGGVVSFKSPGFQDVASIDIRITDMENTDIELADHVASVLAGLANASILNFKQVQGPECQTYELGGEQACTIIYKGDKKGTNIPTLVNATTMQLYSLLDGSLYNIAYTAPAADFNKNLNILRPMLSSFQTLSGPEDVPPVPRFENLTTAK